MADYDVAEWLWPDASQGRQSQDPVDIEWDNPLTEGLRHALDARAGVDLVSGRPLIYVGAPKVSIGKTGKGLSANNSFLAWVPIADRFADEITLVGFYNKLTRVSAGQDIALGLGSSGGNAMLSFSASTVAPNRVNWRNANGGATSYIDYWSNSRTTGVTACLAATVAGLSGGVLRIYWDGLPDGTAALNPAGSNAIYDRISIGGLSRSTSQYAGPGNDSCLNLAFAVTKSPEEVRQISQNAAQLFRSPLRGVYMPYWVASGGASLELASVASSSPSSSAALTTAISPAADTSAAPGSTASLTTGLRLASITGAAPSSNATLATAIKLTSGTSAKPSSSATLAASGSAWAATSSATPGSSARLSTSITFASNTSADAAAEAANLLTMIKLSSSVAAQPSSAAALSTQSRLACESVAQTLSAAHLTTQILLAAAGKAAPSSWATLGPAQTGQDFTGMRLGVSIRPAFAARVSGQRVSVVTSGPRIGCRVTSRF